MTNKNKDTLPKIGIIIFSILLLLNVISALVGVLVLNNMGIHTKPDDIRDKIENMPYTASTPYEIYRGPAIPMEHSVQEM